jgi:adenine-specific DNA-methyltransferase
MYNVEHLGQVFTPDNIVSQMFMLCKNKGRTLEPSCGNGAFSHHISACVAIELDPQHCDKTMLNIDFFDYPTTEKFDTIIGNPPYVRYHDILTETKSKLNSSLFDERSNLYLFFIEKCINHLNDKGELIFITPRDFLKATSSVKLNKFIFDNGTITDLVDLGDDNVFTGYSPNCVIFRFEKGNFSRRTNVCKEFVFANGQLLFTNNNYPVNFNDVFFVKVGAVSGNDKIFANEEFGNIDFVCSYTYKTRKTKRMIFEQKNEYLEQYKDMLLQRKIKHFDMTNWWQWGRLHYISNLKRIYVNTKTRNKKPFFTHDCNNYDGSILAIFPKNQQLDVKTLASQLNNVNWYELGFVCDGRYIFSQRSLENSPLPSVFGDYVYQNTLL